MEFGPVDCFSNPSKCRGGHSGVTITWICGGFVVKSNISIILYEDDHTRKVFCFLTTL